MSLPPANAAGILQTRRFELKARDPDPARTAAACESLGAEPGTEVTQRDTYFQGPRGRLRVRQEEGGGAQLYADERIALVGEEGRRWLFDLGEPEVLIETFSESLGVEAVVVKRRRLFFWGGVRIHLDAVADLGCFIELQVSEAEDFKLALLEVRAETLQRALEIADADLVGESYVELVLGGAADVRR